MADWITIGSGALTAAINPFGAELSSLRDGQGRELMTDADPAFWTGRAPLLFPVVGAVRGNVIRVDGVDYPMEKHGFARRSMFDLVDQAADRAVFRLTDSDATRVHYPFAFTLDMAFVVDGATLTITATIANPGDAVLPASFGYHPAFAWPLPYSGTRGEHRIVFAEDEPDAIRRVRPDGLIDAPSKPSPVAGRTLMLADALFTDDALVWDSVRSRSLTYGPAEGRALEMAFPDTPMLGIWTKPGAAYVCVEPWHGIADPADFVGEFADKPGMMAIAPGASRDCMMSVTLLG